MESNVALKSFNDPTLPERDVFLEAFMRGGFLHVRQRDLRNALAVRRDLRVRGLDRV